MLSRFIKGVVCLFIFVFAAFTFGAAPKGSGIKDQITQQVNQKKADFANEMSQGFASIQSRIGSLQPVQNVAPPAQLGSRVMNFAGSFMPNTAIGTPLSIASGDF